MSPAKISQSRIIQNRIYRLWNLATGIDIQPELFCSKAPPGPLKEERGRGEEREEKTWLLESFITVRQAPYQPSPTKCPPAQQAKGHNPGLSHSPEVRVNCSFSDPRPLPLASVCNFWSSQSRSLWTCFCFFFPLSFICNANCCGGRAQFSSGD